MFNIKVYGWPFKNLNIDIRRGKDYKKYNRPQKDMNKKLENKIIPVVLLGTMFAYTLPVYANTKEETVYTKQDNSGNSYSTIVSTKLTNDDGKELLNDISELMNIKNTNGDETFEQDGNKLVWKANGSNIQYQGNTEKELPIKTTIKYELDGEEVEAKDIVGKSGNVKITVEYENNDVHTKTINGKSVQMYTPFVVVAGTIIDSENNTDVKVTNGKLLENGSKMIAIGMCMPGMQESLGISENDIEIPSSFSIEMNAKEFEMSNIMSYATAKVLDEADLDIFDKLDEIYDKVNEIQDASTQLVDGTNELKEGANQLKAGTNLAYTQFASTRKTYTSKLSVMNDETKLEKAIRNIVNQELEKMLPELENQAIAEATASVESHKDELEKSITETGVTETKKVVQNEISKLDENTLKAFFKENEDTLKVLQDEITKQINEVLKDEELVVLSKMAKQEAIDEVKTVVSTKTTEELNNSVTQIKQGLSQGSVKFLSDSDLATINKQIDALYPVTSDETLQTLKTLASQNEAYAEKYQKAVQSNQVNQILKAFVSQNGEKIADLGAQNALTTVASSIDSMTSNVVDSTVADLEKDGVLDSYINNYMTTLQSKIAQKIGTTDAEKVKEYEEQLASKLSQKLITNIKSDETLNKILSGYEQKLLQEVNTKVDSIANTTATKIAKQYTKTLATEVATNLVESQINDAKNGKVDSVISAEIAKYKEQIQSEIAKIENGLDTLESGLYQLNDGATKLADGAETLSEGMTKFNDEGIAKIVNYINGDAKDLAERMKALKELASEYNNFSGKEDGDEGSVSFIMIIDSLKKDSGSEKVENAANTVVISNSTNESVADETIANNTAKNETSSEE